MIPKEVRERWEREFKPNCKVPKENYLDGREAQYLEMQAEIERLMTVVESGFKNEIALHVHHDWVEMKWQEFKHLNGLEQFKQQHGL